MPNIVDLAKVLMAIYVLGTLFRYTRKRSSDSTPPDVVVEDNPAASRIRTNLANLEKIDPARLMMPVPELGEAINAMFSASDMGEDMVRKRNLPKTVRNGYFFKLRPKPGDEAVFELPGESAKPLPFYKPDSDGMIAWIKQIAEETPMQTYEASVATITGARMLLDSDQQSAEKISYLTGFALPLMGTVEVSASDFRIITNQDVGRYADMLAEPDEWPSDALVNEVRVLIQDLAQHMPDDVPDDMRELFTPRYMFDIDMIPEELVQIRENNQTWCRR